MLCICNVRFHTWAIREAIFPKQRSLVRRYWLCQFTLNCRLISCTWWLLLLLNSLRNSYRIDEEKTVSTDNPQVAVFGCGYWGKNLVRNFHALGALRWVCDVQEDPLRQVQKDFGVRISQDLDSILQDDQVGGVVIAAPAVEHFTLARKSLLAGKNVFVEKPLSLRSSEGRELIALARDGKRILMVGHILEYHPAIHALKELV